MKLEILVATTRRKDLNWISKMNLQCDTIIANQSDYYGYEESLYNGKKIQMLSTKTIGVGKNRNLTLLMSDADIIIFADDDMSYYDGVENAVKKAFEKLPNADVIVFGLDMVRKGSVYERRKENIKKKFLINSLKYGTCRIAVRREALVKKNITFSTLFGGGCLYGSGEDSLFLKDCFQSKLRIYSYPHVLGSCSKDYSSWFTGYDKKFFFDKGALLNAMFPKMKNIVKIYFAIHFLKKSDLNLRTIIRYMNKGITAFENLTDYREEIES